MSASLPRVRLVRPGDEATAERENTVARAINRLSSGATLPRQVSQQLTAVPFGMRIVQLVDVEPDYLVTTVLYGASAGQYIYVAKPAPLRESFTSHNGLTFTPTATNTRSATDGSETETQEIVPPYVAGDEIAAVGPVPGGLNITAADGTDVVWLDLNNWARAWAVSE